MAVPNSLSLREIAKRRMISDMVRFVQPASKWKIMVVDPVSMKVLSQSVKMFDILDENVTLVEMITKRRQPYPNLEAIYFLSPTPEAVQHFIVDFCPGGGKKPLYSAAHLFFLGVLPDALMDKITNSGAGRFIKNLKELYVDFLPLETRVFSLDSPAAFFRLFSPEAGGLPAQQQEMVNMARKLTAALVTMGEYPYVRHYKPPDSDNTRSRRFAHALLNEMERQAKLDPTYQPSTDGNRSTLIIVDRSVDMNSPLLHEFTYQAMAYDLLPMEDGKYLMAAAADGADTTGEKRDKPVPLEESDVLWVQLRHKHIAQAIEEITKQFQKFTSENKAAAAALGQGGQKPDLNALKATLAAMPQFQEMKQKYSIHLSMTQDCMNVFTRHKLAEAGELEQCMATGELPDGSKPKNLVADLVPLLDDPALDEFDKVRLLMLYIIGKEGVQDEDRRKLLHHANIPLHVAEAITNMALLGVKLSRDGKRTKKRKDPKKRGTGSGDLDAAYDLSRYVPAIKSVLEDQVASQLDANEYPYVGAQPQADAQQRTGGTSLRSTKPSWQQKKAGAGAGGAGGAAEPGSPVPKGGRVILFMLGGMTHSEMRCAYEVANVTGKEVVIGATHIVTPKKFVNDLMHLRDPRAFEQYEPAFGFGAGPAPLPELSERERKKLEEKEAKLAAKGGHAAAAPSSGEEGDGKKKKKLFGIF